MPRLRTLELISSVIPRFRIVNRVGRIRSLSANLVSVIGISDAASVGHRVAFPMAGVQGEVVSVSERSVNVLVDGSLGDLKIGQAVQHIGEIGLYPDDSWLGRIVDGDGQPLDDMLLVNGRTMVPLQNPPPAAAKRRAYGGRLESGYALFNTILPIVRGQRLGLFSGAGVGKSSLMASFARDMEADVVVIGLIGERGREVNQFVHTVLARKAWSEAWWLPRHPTNPPWRVGGPPSRPWRWPSIFAIRGRTFF